MVYVGTAGWSAPPGQRADVAQLVEHHLAKVRVAGSNPVVRSAVPRSIRPHSVEWPRGEATACKAVYTGSNPVSTSSVTAGAIGAVWLARFLDTEEVTGSSPVSPTRRPLASKGVSLCLGRPAAIFRAARGVGRCTWGSRCRRRRSHMGAARRGFGSRSASMPAGWSSLDPRARVKGHWPLTCRAASMPSPAWCAPGRGADVDRRPARR